MYNQQDKTPLPHEAYILAPVLSMEKHKTWRQKGPGFWVGSAPTLAGSSCQNYYAFYVLSGTHSAASLTSLTGAKIKKKIAILVWWLKAQVSESKGSRYKSQFCHAPWASFMTCLRLSFLTRKIDKIMYIS